MTSPSAEAGVAAALGWERSTSEAESSRPRPHADVGHEDCGRSRARALSPRSRRRRGHPSAVAPQADGHRLAGMASSSTTRTLTSCSEGAGWSRLSQGVGQGRPRSVGRAPAAAATEPSAPRRAAPRDSAPRRSRHAARQMRTMARPRPSPPCRRVLEESACPEASKTCGRNSGSIPGPSSVTRARCPSRVLHPHLHPPPRRELDGIGQQFQITAAAGSRHPAPARPRGRWPARPDVLAVGGPHGVRCRFDHVGQPHRPAQPELAVTIRDTSRMSARAGSGPGVAIDRLTARRGRGSRPARTGCATRPRWR